MPIPQHNVQLAGLFRSIAELLAAQRANPYRVRAYRRGADALLALDEDIAEVAQRQALEEIEGIGRDLSEKIQEFLRTGKIAFLETLRIPLPEHIRESARLHRSEEIYDPSQYGRLLHGGGCRAVCAARTGGRSV